MSDYWANLATTGDAVRRQLVLLYVLLGAVALPTLLAVPFAVEPSSPPPTSPARSHPRTSTSPGEPPLGDNQEPD